MLPPLLPRARLLLGGLLLPALAGAQPRAARALGQFDGRTDVGAVRHRGSATYDARAQRYVVAGSGQRTPGEPDAFHFVWRRMTGNFILTARADPLGGVADSDRALGWQVRASLDADAPHASAAVRGDGIAALRWRRTRGDTTGERRSPVAGPDVIQLERRGGRFIMSVARFGDTLAATQVDDVALGDTVYVGLFVHGRGDSAEVGEFRDVRITVPAPEGLVPYREYLGANLETLDVTTGRRTLLAESPDAWQAPNWTRDGRALIYNSDGRLYRFDLATRRSREIPTAFATSNNNDHVISFDGRRLAISHHVREENNRSILFTLPLEGGVPRRVTPLGPSYLHGWSADDRHLVYVGERGGEYDIYRIPVEGGEETRLTSTPGLDDGPEYSPDGRWIYFNSVRSGTMQLWRMRPDGSAPEQLTNDGFNNWFPHVSPDGRWVAFLSYGPDVRPSDHPWYKHVYLRLMPAEGGAPRVIAYVYGGQGTINVPSWAPDSRRLAFVSNTGK